MTAEKGGHEVERAGVVQELAFLLIGDTLIDTPIGLFAQLPANALALAVVTSASKVAGEEMAWVPRRWRLA
jgi:hypothetical protein